MAERSMDHVGPYRSLAFSLNEIKSQSRILCRGVTLDKFQRNNCCWVEHRLCGSKGCYLRRREEMESLRILELTKALEIIFFEVFQKVRWIFPKSCRKVCLNSLCICIAFLVLSGLSSHLMLKNPLDSSKGSWWLTFIYKTAGQN